MSTRQLVFSCESHSARGQRGHLGQVPLSPVARPPFLGPGGMEASPAHLSRSPRAPAPGGWPPSGMGLGPRKGDATLSFLTPGPRQIPLSLSRLPAPGTYGSHLTESLCPRGCRTQGEGVQAHLSNYTAIAATGLVLSLQASPETDFSQHSGFSAVP